MVRYLFYHPEQARTTGAFLPKLESMRGLAALVVAIYHGLLVFDAALLIDPSHLWVYEGLVRLMSGAGAVVLFFVLSGYVLGTSMSREEGKGLYGYGCFVLKRFIRLWPAYVVSLCIILAFLACCFHYTVWPDLACGFLEQFQQPLTLPLFLKNLLFVDYSLNQNAWTLRIEFLAAFFLPFLHRFSVNTNRMADVVLIVLLGFVCHVFQKPFFSFLIMFYLGLMIPKWSEVFRALSGKFFSQKVFLFSCLALALLVDSSNVPELVFGVPAAVLASVIIGMLIQDSSEHFAWLETPVLLYLGKISYSFYLVQFLVLYILATCLFQFVPKALLAEYWMAWNAAVIVLDIAISALIAHGMHALVEQRCMQASKFLTTFRFKKLSALSN